MKSSRKVDKRWFCQGLAISVLLVLSLTPATLKADEREDHAQELIKIAEQRLAEGNEDAALRIANIVLSEFSDTRAANKAKEINRAIEPGNRNAKSTTVRTRSRTPAQQNPGSCLLPSNLPKTRRSAFGAAAMSCLIPGSGQFYNNNPLAGCLFGTFSATCWITFTVLLFSEKTYSVDQGTTAMTFLYLADIGIFASHLASAIHAGIVADQINAELGYTMLYPPMDSSYVAAPQQFSSTAIANSSSPSIGVEVTLLRF